MGCFGWNCSVCDEPVLGFPTPGYNKFKQVVVVFDNGDIVSGEYDGYGRVRGCELIDLDGHFKFVHKPCYKKQPFKKLKVAKHDQTQAGGYDEKGMIEHFGEPDLSEIKHEARYACVICRSEWKTKYSRGVCPNGCEFPACPEHGKRTMNEIYDDPKVKFEKGLERFKNLCQPCLARHQEQVVMLDRDETLAICGHEGCYTRGVPAPVEVLHEKADKSFWEKEENAAHHPTRCKSCGKRDKLTVLKLKKLRRKKVEA